MKQIQNSCKIFQEGPLISILMLLFPEGTSYKIKKCINIQPYNINRSVKLTLIVTLTVS